MIPYMLKQRAIFFLLIIPIVIIHYPAISFSGVESAKNEKNPPPPLKGQVLFEELFQDNKNNWLIEENPLFKINIENGKYVLEQLTDGREKAIVNYIFHLPDKIDFKIEASIEKIQGADNLGYGLIWGSVDINNQYRFYISGNGKYSVKKYEIGKESYIVPWKKYREAGKTDSKNKLTIVKFNCFTRFYVNDEYLDEIQNVFLYGDKVGFVTDGKQKIAVEDIRVIKVEEEIPTDKKCPEPQPQGSPLPEQKEKEEKPVTELPI